jgi:hypothetical protein
MIKPRFLKSLFGENPKSTKRSMQHLFSKYNSKFTYATATSPRAIALPLINFYAIVPQEISAI